jgi:hypothetical protein
LENNLRLSGPQVGMKKTSRLNISRIVSKILHVNIETYPLGNFQRISLVIFTQNEPCRPES